MAHVIGAFLGDGCLYRWKKHYQVWIVGEEEFCKKAASGLAACTGSRVVHRKYGDRNAWYVRADNVGLYLLLKMVRENLDVVPRILGERGNLSHLRFVEGAFDAEGCVKVICGKDRKTPKICLGFCNTSGAFTELVRSQIRNATNTNPHLSVQKDVRPNRKRAFHLRLYRREEVVRFLSLVQTSKLTRTKATHISELTKK